MKFRKKWTFVWEVAKGSKRIVPFLPVDKNKGAWI